ncbi:MAG: LPD38 domain-containing protein [Aquabacterium commune]|uniref:LPD38 domain-containing protein n=1 Tax=Aquabacterium commune TaxID=70586 RepID=UPI003BB1465A
MANQTLKPFNGELDPVKDTPAGLKPFTGTLDGEKPQRTLAQAAKDTGAQLAEGVNTTLGAIPSVVAPQSRAAGFFRDNAQYWRDQQSDVLKDRIAASDQRIQEAGKDGVLSQIGTAASEYWNDPAQAARLVATNLPSMAATLGTGAAAGLAAKGVAAARGLDAANKAALAAKYGTTTAAATNAALNAGGARGEAFEDLQKTALAQGMTPEQAEQASVSGSILPGVVGGVAGAISGKIGLEKAILGQATTGAAMRKAAGAFGAELAGEQIEELAPKVAANYQVGRIDPGRTLTDDLGRTMVETAIGSGPGAVVAGGASAMRTGETLPPPGAGEPTTSPGAADPNAPQRPQVTPPEAPDLTTSPGAGVARDGMDFTREVDTSGLSLQDPAELERARAATADYQPGDTTPQWETSMGAAAARQGLDMPAPEFDTGTLGLESQGRALTPSERMGINPAAGALSRTAAVAVDSGATPVQFLGATGRDLQARATGPGVANESNVIDVQGRLVEDRAISTPRRLTDQQDGMAARALGGDIAAQPPANRGSVPAPTNLRDAIARIRAQKQEAANAQATAPEAAPTAQSVPAAGTGAVEAAGLTENKVGRKDSAQIAQPESVVGEVQRSAAPSAITPTTTQGNADGPQASQAQQAATQPAQAAAPAAKPAPELASAPAPAGAPEVRALSNGTPAENLGAQAAPATGAQAAAQQGAQEQAAKAEAAAKRAEDAAAKAEEERKRIAHASVRAADSFELGQDPMDSLTGQGSMFDAQEPEQQAPAATEAMQTKEDDAGNVAMFSRTGAKSSNAQQPTTRAWYDRFVSLLPASYRNDPHRREPLPTEDWNVQRASEVRSKVEALNKQLRGADDRKGYGPVSVDGLGNLQVDARDVSAADLTGGIMALANELGAGIAATNVRSADARALQNSGFVPESSLAAIADRLMQRPFASPTNNYAKDSAPGTVMTYKPRGFPAALFARDVAQNNATPAISRADSNARNVATQLLVDGLTEKWTRAPEIIVARNMQDPQVPQAVRDYDETLKSQGATGEARGFIYKGKVYLLSDELKGPQQIAEVLFHEVLGHYGLRGAFGDSLDTILQQIGTMRRRDVVAKAREYGLFDKDALGGMDKKTASVAQIWAAMSSKDRLSAAEEVLAEMAQTQPNIGFVQRAIAAIRNWLRSNVPGFKSLRLTDADIIQAYILPARGFVTRSKETGAQSLERAMMAFSRTATDQAQTEAGSPDIRFSRTSTATGTQSAWDAPVQTGFDDVIYKLQDKNIDLKRVVEAIAKSAGQVADSVNAYLKEELFHKRAAKRVEDFGARELKPLMNQMRLMGLGMEDVEEYLHARHAKEANAVIAQRNPGVPGLQDGGSGMTNQAADNYFAKLDPAQRRKLEAVAKNVDAIIDKTRKLYVSYGLENQDVVDGWASMYQHYIPLMREDKDGGMGTGQGFSVKGKETKGRTGSTRKVVDILANIASQREKLIVRGEKNIVAQALVGLAQANPNPDFWEVRSQAPTERVFDPKTGVVVDRPDPLFKSRENVAVAKVKDANGKVTEQMVVFNEDNPRAVRMAAAMKNLDAGNLEGLLGMSAKVTRYFSAINTQYNPVFGVVNLVRDVQGAMVNLAATPLAGQQGKIARDTASALRGIYGDIRKTRKGGQATSQWSQLWEQMQDDGGTTGYRELFTTSADRANNLKSILNPEGWMDNKWGKFFTAGGRLKVPMSVAQKGATEIFGWLSDYNEAMENGVRLAAYKAALDKGMSREQAASLAKNLTVNFNRKGQVGQQAGAVYAFFNAAMQGTARIGQTLFDMDGGDISTLRLSKTGKAVVYGGVMLGVMQALALAGAGFDAEDPPEFVRERSLIIPTGGKTYVTIPMPLGLHVIPGIGRHATEFALSGFDKPAKRAVSVVGMFADAFNPIGNAGLSMQTLAPTALDPLVALTENKDWTGNPIARVSSNKALPGHTQWKDTATGFSKVVAEAINWASGGNEYVAGAFSPTPDQIDYLLAQVGGGVARELSKISQSTSATVNGEDLPIYKIPLVGRFAGNAASQASQGTAFYTNLDKLNALETEIKGLRKDGRFGEAAQLVRENPQAAMIPMANRAERDVQKLRREKRELIAKDASREEVRAKDEQITAVMTRLNQAAERRKAVSQ